MLHHFVEGRGPVVLLLHGFALDARMWRSQVLALREHYRTLAVDLPDFGPLPVPAGGRTAARAALEVLDFLPAQTAHVVGFSLGGAVAVDFTLAFADRVRSLTLIAPPPASVA